MSVSGSSATGHCSNVSNTGSRLNCRDPISSVLFDGVIPTLTGLDGDMWASQLLTLQKTTHTRPTVIFDFTDTPPGYVELSGRLEVVMFNCPNMGISASTIRVSSSSSPSVSSTPLKDVNINITSCDSLVRVCTPIMTVQPSIYLQFPYSDMVYLAEVTFYAASSASTCPQDTIITTAPPDTIAPSTTALEVLQTVSLTTTPSGTTNTSVTSEVSTNTTASTGSKSIINVIIPVVVVICVVFMIVGIMAAVLILWRYHKHKTIHHTALGEGHSHAHTHSHPPPVKMCEETGQVCYSSPPEALGQLSPSHDTYSRLQQDASEGRGGVPSHQGGSNEEGEYSALSHGNSPHVLGGGGEDSASQINAQIDKKAKKKKSTATEMSTLVTYSSLDKERSRVHTQQVDTAMDQLYDRVDNQNESDMPAHPNTSEAGTLYAQVDKKKKKMKKVEVATQCHTPEADAPMDQLYAQVDKKKKEQKKCEVTAHPDADTAVNQLYFQVDKKKKKMKKGEVATHCHTPETYAPMDQLYAQVDKKKKQKKCEVTVHPDADTAVNQLYAQVDKKKKKVREDSNSA